MKAYDIHWDVDLEEIYNLMNNIPTETATEKFEIPYGTWNNMTTEERYDFVLDHYHNVEDQLLEEFLGLPYETEVPKKITSKYSKEELENNYNDEIADWLSDKYEYCVNFYELDTIC